MRRETLLTTAVNVLDLSGVTSLLKPFYGGAGAILSFHRVIPDSSVTLVPGNAVTVPQLRNLLKFLRGSGVDLVHLSEVPSRLRERISRRFVAITLDDGYRDNLESALPLFREFAAPFTIFPCTGFLNRTNILSYDLLEALCLQRDRVAWKHPQSGQVEFIRLPEEGKLAFFRRVQTSAGHLTGIGECIAGACEKENLPVADIQDRLFLSWEQLKEISRDPLASVGVHTETHAWLGSLKKNEAESEIETSRHELERQLAEPVNLIAYPFGCPGACGPREFEMAQRMGFTLGLTTKRGNVHSSHGDNLWSLPRHTLSMAAHSRTVRYLRISLNGIWDTPLNGLVFTR
jgi:peptidoglycan/xylan/chitin deacetylase (PgdA/CDA1 family)